MLCLNSPQTEIFLCSPEFTEKETIVGNIYNIFNICTAGKSNDNISSWFLLRTICCVSNCSHYSRLVNASYKKERGDRLDKNVGDDPRF